MNILIQYIITFIIIICGIANLCSSYYYVLINKQAIDWPFD